MISVFLFSLVYSSYFNRELLLEMQKRERENKIGRSTSEQQEQQDEEKYDPNRYIVMELLKPAITENYIISWKSVYDNQSKLQKTKITNELGVYGVYLR
jgi:hypothetical protein